jgi:hypothetical protein
MRLPQLRHFAPHLSVLKKEEEPLKKTQKKTGANSAPQLRHFARNSAVLGKEEEFLQLHYILVRHCWRRLYYCGPFFIISFS